MSSWWSSFTILVYEHLSVYKTYIEYLDFSFLINADPYYSERSGLYIGQGKTMLSRSGMFRVPQGVAVDMSNRVFKLPSFHGIFDDSLEQYDILCIYCFL